MAETKFLILLGSILVAVMLMFQSLNIAQARAEEKVSALESAIIKIGDIDNKVNAIAADVATIKGVLQISEIIK